MKILAWLGERATAALAVGAILGLVVPAPTEIMQDLLPSLIFIAISAGFVMIDEDAVKRSWRSPVLSWLLIVWCLVGLPVVIAVVFKWVPIGRGLEQSIILWAVSPPITAATMFAILLRLDAAIAMSVSFTALLVLPFTGPPLSLALADLPVEIDALTLVGRVAAFVGAAAIAALLIRRMLGPRLLLKRSAEISGVAVLVLVVYAAVVIGSVRDVITGDPERFALFIVVAFAVNIAAQAATGFVFAWSGRARRGSAAVLAGNRAMAVMIANLGAGATPDIMLFFVAAHFPIFILPWVLKRIYAPAIQSGEAQS